MVSGSRSTCAWVTPWPALVNDSSASMKRGSPSPYDPALERSKVFLVGGATNSNERSCPVMYTKNRGGGSPSSAHAAAHAWHWCEGCRGVPAGVRGLPNYPYHRKCKDEQHNTQCHHHSDDPAAMKARGCRRRLAGAARAEGRPVARAGARSMLHVLLSTIHRSIHLLHMLHLILIPSIGIPYGFRFRILKSDFRMQNS